MSIYAGLCKIATATQIFRGRILIFNATLHFDFNTPLMRRNVMADAKTEAAPKAAAKKAAVKKAPAKAKKAPAKKKPAAKTKAKAKAKAKPADEAAD